MSDSRSSIAYKISLGVSAVILVALTGLLTDTVIDIWPSLGSQSEMCKKAEMIPEDQKAEFLELIKRAGKINCKFGDIPVTRVNLGGTHTFLSPDQGLFGLVAIFGALGALVQSLRSIGVTVMGKGGNSISLVWNLLRPFAAAALALIFYVGVRTLFMPSGLLTAANPYGFITMAAVVGLFVDHALDWLRPGGNALARNGD